MRKVIDIGVTSLVIAAFIVGGYCHALEREQTVAATTGNDDAYDFVPVTVPETAEQPVAEKKLKKPSFLRYVWRIGIAPVMVLVRFPRDEETDMYQTYLEHVNKGTDRQWKRDKFSTIKRKDYSSRDIASEEKKPEPAPGGRANETATQPQSGATSDAPSSDTP